MNDQLNNKQTDADAVVATAAENSAIAEEPFNSEIDRLHTPNSADNSVDENSQESTLPTANLRVPEMKSTVAVVRDTASGHLQKEGEYEKPISSAPHEDVVAIVDTQSESKTSEKSEPERPGQEVATVTGGSTVTNLGPVQTQTNINEQKIYKLSGDLACKIWTLRREEWLKVEQVFVAPPGFEQFVERYRNSGSRVFILSGPEQTGRYTAAVELGRQLRGGVSQEWCHLVQSPSERCATLVDLTRDLQPQLGAVYIVEQVNRAGLSPDGCDSRYIQILERQLIEKEAWLILTADASSAAWESAATPVLTLPSDCWCDSQRTGELILRHIEWYQSGRAERFIPPELVAAVREIREELVPLLSAPYLVDRFFQQLNDSELISAEAGSRNQRLIEIAKQRCRADPMAADRWFQQLTPNERVFALLVRLFEGLQRPWIEETYLAEAQRLRNEGVELHDVRDIGLDDLCQRVRAIETHSGLLLVDAACGRVLDTQLRNYHHLLWSLTDRIKGLLIAFSRHDEWWIRQLLGRAVGRLGVHRPERLFAFLNELVTHEQDSIAVVPGFVMQEVCRRSGDQLGVMLQWLKSQIPESPTSGDWSGRRVWSCLVAIGRFYPDLAALAERQRGGNPDVAGNPVAALDVVDGVLKRLAGWRKVYVNHRLGDLGDEVRIPAIRVLAEAKLKEEFLSTFSRTFIAIFRERATEIVKLLQEWLSDPDDGEETVSPDPQSDAGRERAEKERRSRRMTAIGIGRELFRFNHNADQLVDDRHGPLLDLLPLLFNNQEEPAEDLLSIVLKWWQREDWQGRIEAALLNITTTAKLKPRRTLCRALLRTWLSSELPNARRCAERLMARARALEGVPLEPLDELRALLVVDASEQAQFSDSAATLGYDLFEWLLPQIKVDIARLGDQKLVAEPVARDSFQLEVSRSRLLAPLLERLDPDRYRFVLVLYWQDSVDNAPAGADVPQATCGVLDWEDVTESRWFERLIPMPVAGATLPRFALEEVPEFLRELVADLNKDARRLNQVAVEAVFDTVDPEIRRRLCVAAALRSADEWWTAFARFAPEPPSTVPADLALQLDRWADGEHVSEECDQCRWLLNAVLWLGVADPALAVELTGKWLNSNAPRRRGLGGAVANVLVETHFGSRTVLAGKQLPGLSVEWFSPLLGLGPLAASHRLPRPVKTLLKFCRRMAADSGWLTRIRTPPHGRAEFAEMLRLAPAASRPEIEEQLDRFSQIDADWGETELPSTVRPLADWLRFRLNIANRLQLQAPVDGSNFGVVVVAPVLARSRSDWLRSLLKGLNVQLNTDAMMFGFVLGDVEPATMPGERFDRILEAAREADGPGLLAPLLECVPRQRCGFVLFIAENEPLDWKDIRHEWRDVGFVLLPPNVFHTAWANLWKLLPVTAQVDEQCKSIGAVLMNCLRRDDHGAPNANDSTEASHAMAVTTS